MANACNYSRPLDREKLLEDCDEETAFVNHCLQVFVRETQIDMDSLAAALGNHDFLQIARIAHRIKGASALIRATFLRDEASRLHILTGEGQEAEAARSVARLQAEFEAFKRFIASLPPS